MKIKLTVRIAPVALLLATACGGGGGESTGDSNELKAAISTAFVENIDANGVDFKADKSLGDCVATSLLDDSEYASNLEDAYAEGLTGQKLLDATGDTESDVEISRKIFTCFSSEQLAILLSSQSAVADASTEEGRACLAKEFDSIDKSVLIDGIFGMSGVGQSTEATSKITSAMASCFGVNPADQ